MKETATGSMKRGQRITKPGDGLASGVETIKLFVARYLLTTLAIVGFPLLGYYVKPIRLLIADILLTNIASIDRLIAGLTTLLVLWGGVLLCQFMIRSPSFDRMDRTVAKIPSPIRKHIGLPLQWIFSTSTQWLYHLAKSGRSFSQGISAWLINITVAIVGLIVARYMPLSPSWLHGMDDFWPLPGGFLRMVGMLAALVTLWLGFGTLFGSAEVLDGPERGDGTPQRHARVWRRTGEVLSVLILITFILEGLWIAVEYFDGVSMTVYTVWAFFCLAFAGIATALLVDYLNDNTVLPWRWIAVAVLVGVASLPSHIDLEPPNVANDDAAPSTVADDAVAPHQTLTARWCVAALNRLQNQPQGPVIIVTASGGGSRAALVAALSLEIIEQQFDPNGPRPACVWLASGVSGGSIALAAHFYPAPEQTTRQAAVKDYLGPIFRGFLTPFANRGESLTAYWDREFPWDSIDQTTTDPTKPMLITGVADIDTGRRVMVGFPRLPTDWYQRYQLTRQDQTMVWTLLDSDHDPYSFSTLVSDGHRFNIRLTRGVRISSSFPFGFEPTRVTVDVPKPNRQPRDVVHFLDGGMVDNTGVDSVLAVLKSIDQSETDEGKQLTEELRRRGILLIEIDAGASSGEVTRSGPLSRLAQPLGGYNRGVFTAAKRARDRNIAELKQRFKDRFVTEAIRSHPSGDQVDEIVTTLALPRNDARRLVRSFHRPKTRRDIKEALQNRYRQLQRPAKLPR